MADTLTRMLNYGLYDGRAAVFNNTEAYVFSGTQWDKAMVADMVKEDKRGTAYGLYNLAIGITVFPASLLFGLTWDRFGAETAFLASAAVSMVSAGLLMTVKPKHAQ